MQLTKEEHQLVKLLVEKELREIEKHEKYFQNMISSPDLSVVLMKNNELEFLASQEKYHQFLLTMKDKL